MDLPFEMSGIPSALLGGGAALVVALILYPAYNKAYDGIGEALFGKNAKKKRRVKKWRKSLDRIKDLMIEDEFSMTMANQNTISTLDKYISTYQWEED